MDRRKILLLIFDGLGDRPVAELGHKTPLEAAPKPALDWFAANGINGLPAPLAPGGRPGRRREGTEELAKALDGIKIGRVKVIFRAGTEHRGALVLRGKGLSPRVSDTDPHEHGVPVPDAKPLVPKAKGTAKALNAFTRAAHKALKDHPVNQERGAKGGMPGNPR